MKKQITEKPKFLYEVIPLLALAVLLVICELIYLQLLQLDAVNGWTPVLTFWLEMGALFGFYGASIWVVGKSANHRKAILFLIILGAILFRLTLLPAGLPFDATAAEKFEALKTDLDGQEVTFEKFQLFDSDIWRYLWDGHIWANGVNPYQYAPADEMLDEFSGDSVVSEEESDEGEQTDVIGSGESNSV